MFVKLPSFYFSWPCNTLQLDTEKSRKKDKEIKQVGRSHTWLKSIRHDLLCSLASPIPSPSLGFALFCCYAKHTETDTRWPCVSDRIIVSELLNAGEAGFFFCFRIQPSNGVALPSSGRECCCSRMFNAKVNRLKHGDFPLSLNDQQCQWYLANIFEFPALSFFPYKSTARFTLFRLCFIPLILSLSLPLSEQKSWQFLYCEKLEIALFYVDVFLLSLWLISTVAFFLK